MQMRAQDSPPSIFTADQLPRCLQGTWEWKQGVGAALPLPAMYCELQRGRRADIPLALRKKGMSRKVLKKM